MWMFCGNTRMISPSLATVKLDCVDGSGFDIAAW